MFATYKSLNHAIRRSAKKLIGHLLLVMLILTSGLFVWTSMKIAMQSYYELLIAPQLLEEIGFDTGSPYFSIDGVSQEVLAFQRVVPGSSFYIAGIRDGDILLNELDFVELYQLICSSRGNAIQLRILHSHWKERVHSSEAVTLQIWIPARTARSPC